ncbi:ATP-binding cassette domain-containing protein [Cuneatibacter sp. NSJ-177]|uniref:ATP-binding cassette domain-containing protein n=1 Tax=Cuneatibacter sp. NSJ-177 TaxID=2931401 RepID=UPI001FD54722|nr:ATP-binding cassette domain-containing protein [Cuneatibacter sp. NSJ-177]MCJ7835400.1 ATP-binding cassette domain-containing protein [Cuneatibacter sp. NSJ-177]
MLQIKNLTITHKKDLRPILTDFSFVLRPGDKAAVIGEEGNGKSTLLKLIAGDPQVERYIEFTGEILRNQARIGYLAQEWTEEEKKMPIYPWFSSRPGFDGRTPKELSALASKLRLSLDQFYSDQVIGTLSGGERTKLQLASLLLTDPDVLLLDEPSNDIDMKTLAWLEQFILGCRCPVLYISHDEVLLERTANVIIHLEQIRKKTVPRHTIARTCYEKYIAEREHLLARQEQTAKKEHSEFAKKQERLQRIEQKVEHQQNQISRQDPFGAAILKRKMHSVKSMEKRFEKEQENLTERPDAEEAIFFRFSDQIRVPNGKRVLDLEVPELRNGGRLLAREIRLRITGPEKVGIFGENGVGKTTLLRQIAATFTGRTDLKAAYMPQNYEEVLNLDQTPVEALSLTGEKEEISRICTYLGSLKYTEEERSHPIRDLSGGQKAKILLLSLSLSGCEVLLLDEPTRNFSPLSNPVIRRMLSAFPGAIISVSHDRKYLKEVCTRLYCLTKDGLTPMEPEDLE